MDWTLSYRAQLRPDSCGFSTMVRAPSSNLLKKWVEKAIKEPSVLKPHSLSTRTTCKPSHTIATSQCQSTTHQRKTVDNIGTLCLSKNNRHFHKMFGIKFVTQTELFLQQLFLLKFFLVTIQQLRLVVKLQVKLQIHLLNRKVKQTKPPAAFMAKFSTTEVSKTCNQVI